MQHWINRARPLHRCGMFVERAVEIVAPEERYVCRTNRPKIARAPEERNCQKHSAPTERPREIDLVLQTSSSAGAWNDFDSIVWWFYKYSPFRTRISHGRPYKHIAPLESRSIFVGRLYKRTDWFPFATVLVARGLARLLAFYFSCSEKRSASHSRSAWSHS